MVEPNWYLVFHAVSGGLMGWAGKHTLGQKREILKFICVGPY
jgi:hypothetical protein